jgi:NitT/TauT family transport system ATP-binding protein
MLQDDALFEHMNIEQNVLLGLKILKKLDKKTSNDACKLLKKYDLYRFKDKRPSQLSGGMKQRVVCI